MNSARYISILLSLVVVLCPFNCLLSSCLAGSDGESKVISSCCHSCMPTDSPEKPAPSESKDCECRDCFCRGALPTNDVSTEFLSVELTSVFVEWLKPLVETTASLSPQLNQTGFLFKPDSSRAEARATLSCWLI